MIHFLPTIFASVCRFPLSPKYFSDFYFNDDREIYCATKHDIILHLLHSLNQTIKFGICVGFVVRMGETYSLFNRTVSVSGVCHASIFPPRKSGTCILIERDKKNNKHNNNNNTVIGAMSTLSSKCVCQKAHIKRHKLNCVWCEGFHWEIKVFRRNKIANKLAARLYFFVCLLKRRQNIRTSSTIDGPRFWSWTYTVLDQCLWARYIYTLNVMWVCTPDAIWFGCMLIGLAD